MSWPANSNQAAALAAVARLTHIPYAASVRSYTALCRDPLKIALYFEKRIRTSRAMIAAGGGGGAALHRRQRTAAWVAKYLFFLRLPIHDLFLSLVDPRYKVVEYCCPEVEAVVAVICLNCPAMRCRGCCAPAKKQAAAGGGRQASGSTTEEAGPPPAKKTMKVTLRVKKNSATGWSVATAERKSVGKFIPVTYFKDLSLTICKNSAKICFFILCYFVCTKNLYFKGTLTRDF
jgi:hypothetical protein